MRRIARKTAVPLENASLIEYANEFQGVHAAPLPESMASPLLGYNTNVRHKGKLYHIQTEDSGINHPHIMTHLFADGGRIVATKKSSYSDHVGQANYQEIVKKMMQAQHKAMFIALRDGVYDEGGPESNRIDVAALEEAAARLTDENIATADTSRGAGRYSHTRPPAAAEPPPPSRPPESIFGSDLLSEKSLDEVILSYLAEDLEDASG